MRSRTHFGVFRRQTGKLLAHLACLSAHFSRSRTDCSDRPVANAILDLPKFAQADHYGWVLT